MLITKQTRLYAGIGDAISHLIDHARPGEVLVPVVITDGQDNLSRWYELDRSCSDTNKMATAVETGKRILGVRRMLDAMWGVQCIPFVIGVGNDKQIDRDAIVTLGGEGDFDTFHILNFNALADLLTVRVIRRITERVGVLGRASGVVMERQRLVRPPVAYALVIDRSGSMSDPV